MNSDFVVYIDFDKTLYDTTRFSNDLWSQFANRTDLQATDIKSHSAEHFFHPTLGGYEFEKHVARYNLDATEMWTDLHEMTLKNYLYDDSSDFIASLFDHGLHPKILTFGETKFQLAKILPSLQYLAGGRLSAADIHVVDKKKNMHIQALHTGQHGVLVDDKPDQDLPSGFTEICIDRSNVVTQPAIHDDVVIVSNLSQARDVILMLSGK